MALHFFTIPVSAPAIPQAELNAFLAQHRVLVVERRFVDLGAGSFWAICVDVIAAGVRPGGRDIISSGRNRIDYKQVLSPDEFLGFSRLRDLRKEIATAEAVPVYAVFTNEQLARVVQTRCQSKADLEAVEGIGAARIEKYGMQLLAAVATLSKLPAEPAVESFSWRPDHLELTVRPGRPHNRISEKWLVSGVVPPKQWQTAHEFLSARIPGEGEPTSDSVKDQTAPDESPS